VLLHRGGNSTALFYARYKTTPLGSDPFGRDLCCLLNRRGLADGLAAPEEDLQQVVAKRR
jgi:hypothetical protein